METRGKAFELLDNAGRAIGRESPGAPGRLRRFVACGPRESSCEHSKQDARRK
jgi:hypothetical protein